MASLWRSSRNRAKFAAQLWRGLNQVCVTRNRKLSSLISDGPCCLSGQALGVARTFGAFVRRSSCLSPEMGDQGIGPHERWQTAAEWLCAFECQNKCACSTSIADILGSVRTGRPGNGTKFSSMRCFPSKREGCRPACSFSLRIRVWSVGNAIAR